MAEKWERVVGPLDPGQSRWETVQEPQITAPAGTGIPYKDPSQTFRQQQAQQEWVRSEEQKRADIEAFKQQWGPLESAAIVASNELVQPALGAGILSTKTAGMTHVPRKLEAISGAVQGLTEQMTEAYPETEFAKIAPYLATGPAATAAYLKAVNRMAPGVMRNIAAGPIASSVIPGTVEGGLLAGLNPYQSALEGAALGAGGAYAGQLAGGLISKGATNLSPYDESILNIAKDWKLKDHPNRSIYDYLMPGAKSGNLGMMEVDQAISKNSKARQAVSHRFNVPQNEISRKVFNVAGLDRDHVNPGDMWKHKKALGKKYDALEAQSSPAFTEEHFDMLEAAKDEFIQTAPSTAKPGWVEDLAERFPKHDITPAQYKGYKNDLKKVINSLSGKPLGEEQAAKLGFAQKALQILRSTMRGGLPSEDLLRQWDELDSQFAATTFLEENRIIDEGTVDLKKLYTAMNTKNPDQLQSMRGPWADMSKAAHLGKYIEDSKQPTLGVHNVINQFMGGRQKKTGPLGALTNIFGESRLLPRSAIQYYSWAHPKRGPWRLPQEAPIVTGGVGSAISRGTLMEEDK